MTLKLIKYPSCNSRSSIWSSRSKKGW